MPGMGVLIPAMQCGVDFGFQHNIVPFGHEIEVYEAPVDVVNDLAAGRFFGEQDGTAAAERLGVQRVLRDQRQDVFQHPLLAAIIRNWCLHCKISLKVVFLHLSSIKTGAYTLQGLLPSLSWCVRTFIIAASLRPGLHGDGGFFIPPVCQNRSLSGYPAV